MNSFAITTSGRKVCNIITEDARPKMTDFAPNSKFIELSGCETLGNLWHGATKKELKNTKVSQKIVTRLSRRVARLQA